MFFLPVQLPYPTALITAIPQPHAAVGAAPAISVAAGAAVTAAVEAHDPALHHARAGQVDVEPWRHHHLHAGRLQPHHPAGCGVLHELRVEARASLRAHNRERLVHGARQEADAPHGLGGKEEGLQ